MSIIIFHGFLARTSRQLADNLGAACKAVAGGLVALYGLNELVYRLTNLLVGNRTNLNNATISAQIDAAPHMTVLIVVFLAPSCGGGALPGAGVREPAGKEPPGGLCDRVCCSRCCMSGSSRW